MAIFLFLICFATYLFTLYPTVSAFRDAGDLTSSVFTLGIAHPPGYPLYIILGKIWTVLIPFGNIGYRLNLFSAFTSSLCIVMVYFIVRKISKDSHSHFSAILPSTVAVLTLAFSTAFWQQSILAEIYSLNALFAVLIIYLLFVTRHSLLATFLFGLGLGNHHTLVLLIPGIIYLLIKRLGRTFLPSTFYLLPAFLLGFSVYLFLPIRAKQQPLNNWGNPQTIRNFANVLMRADYGTVKLSSRHSGSTNTLTDSTKMSYQLFKNQFGWFGIILAIIGIFFCFYSETFVGSRFLSVGYTILLLFFFTGPFFIFLSRLPNNEFSLVMLEPGCALSAIFIAIIIGTGVDGHTDFLTGREKVKKLQGKKSFPFSPSYFLTFSLFLLVPLSMFYRNFQQLNKRNNFLALDYGKNLLRSIPKNSYLTMTADIPIFTVNYLQNVEKKRSDVKVVLHSFMHWRIVEYEQKYPEIFQNENSVSTVDTLLKKSDRFPVFTEGVHAGLESYVIPKGLSCHVSKSFLTTAAIQKVKKVRQSGFLFELYPFRKSKNVLDYYEKVVISYYTDACINSDVILSQAGLKTESKTAFQRKLKYEK